MFLFVFLEALGSCAPASSPPAAGPTELAQAAGDLPAVSLGGYVFERRRLGNGLHAVAARDEGEGVSVFVVIAGGMIQETPKTTGLAHLTEHAMYTGTAKNGPGDHDRRIREWGS